MDQVANEITIAAADETKLDELYGAACASAPTYEHVVLTFFCKAVREAFGHDEEAANVRDVFLFAREHYGYMSADELDAVNEANEEDGVCSHGLDRDCCPAGCGG